MKTKFLIFLLVIAAIVTVLWIFEGKREPQKFSDVLFSYHGTTDSMINTFELNIPQTRYIS